MGKFLNDFSKEMNKTADIYNQSKVFSNGKFTTTYSLVLSNVKCGFWTGSQAESLVGERFKTIIDGVIIINPDLVSSITITRDSKITIDSTDYSVINADDVMFQGEVLIVGVKEKT